MKGCRRLGDTFWLFYDNWLANQIIFLSVTSGESIRHTVNVATSYFLIVFKCCETVILHWNLYLQWWLTSINLICILIHKEKERHQHFGCKNKFYFAGAGRLSSRFIQNNEERPAFQTFSDEITGEKRLIKMCCDNELEQHALSRRQW